VSSFSSILAHVKYGLGLKVHFYSFSFLFYATGIERDLTMEFVCVTTSAVLCIEILDVGL